MFDQRSIASNVSRWTGHGLKFPKELAQAVETFETLVYTEVGYQPVFDIDGVTADNAEQKIREYADELAMSETNGGLSPLEKAKKFAVESAARRVNAQARAAVPELIEQLTPEFNQHAATYVEAVAKLPEVITSDSLVATGVDALAAYGDAQREALYINGISSWVFETSYLSGILSKEVDGVLRVLRPTTKLELIKLDEASHRQADSTLYAINPVLFTAARLGVEFGINTVTEAAELRADLDSISMKGAAF